MRITIQTMSATITKMIIAISHSGQTMIVFSRINSSPKNPYCLLRSENSYCR
ncbi:hypothetical protein IJH33_00420 [Candidatus Saccharibacteria bacterium]|nr:hypothetical protein [Candidatus Saccharibacteria bacterium]